MGKDWDRALPDKRIWEECLRVLKDGAFAFVMSIPRADCLSRMIISLEDAGFRVNFTPIYWAYASGFPKAQNIAKKIDTRLGLRGEIIGKKKIVDVQSYGSVGDLYQQVNKLPMKEVNITTRVSPQAKALDGSYGGWQPKPAVEVVIVAMKPLSEKTFVDQALKNGKGITWLDDGRIPFENNDDIGDKTRFQKTDGGIFLASDPANTEVGLKGGRFPANLIVSDDVLNDGRDRASGRLLTHHHRSGQSNLGQTFKIRDRTGESANFGGDSGSFSRYFDLDKWFSERIKLLPKSIQKTFPFLIVPKASKSEKNKGCEDLEKRTIRSEEGDPINWDLSEGKVRARMVTKPQCNYHPTVKPLKLMSYLIILGSREGDLVLDPFIGSGTTALACQMLNRECIGIEINKEYYEIAIRRIAQKNLV